MPTAKIRQSPGVRKPGAKGNSMVTRASMRGAARSGGIAGGRYAKPGTPRIRIPGLPVTTPGTNRLPRVTGVIAGNKPTLPTSVAPPRYRV